MKNKKKKVLIFYQSPAEIVEILRVIKKYHFGTVIILVTGGKPLMKIIERIKLKKNFGVIVYEFHCLRLINPLNILKIYFRFRYSYLSRIILNIKYKDVFFFNYCWDYVAPFFLDKINAEKIIFINFYKRRLINGKMKLKQLIQKFIYTFLYGNRNIKIVYDKKWNTINFYTSKKIYEEISISKLPNIILNLQLEKNAKKNKKIIYLDSNEESEYGDEFRKILSTVFEIIKNSGYSIIVKKHPVWNLSEFFSSDLNKYNCILDPIPIEFYDLKKIDKIFGFTSLSLSKIAINYPCIRVFSILKLFSLKKNIKKIELNNFQYHLNKMQGFNNKINYPRTFAEIRKII
jgi:hypothetical protein